MKVRQNKSLLRICLSLLTVMAFLVVTACDTTSSSPTATTAPKAAATTAPAAATAAPTKAAAATTPAAAATAAPTGQKKELKIGVVAPMTGAGAAWGQALDKGMRMAAKEANDKGGLKIAGDTYTVNIITYDDKYTGDGGVAAATKLIGDDKVKFIFGSISSASVLAMQSVTEPAQVLLLPNSYSSEVVAPNKPYTLRIVMTSRQFSPIMYDWLKKTYPNIKTVAVFSPNDASGKAVSEDAINAAKALGYQVVADEYFERGITDFYPLATKLLAKNPDLIDPGATAPGDLGIFLKQVKELGFKGLTMSTPGQDPETLFKIAGASADGHVSPITDMDDPGVKAFVAKYNKLYPNETLNTITLAFYDPAVALFATMEKIGSIEPVKVRDAMVATKFNGTVGPFVFGGKKSYGIGQQIFGPSWLGQMKNGKQVVLQKVDGAALAD